uniref:VPS13_C domain-containing protein n=1 Tax=Meloidogyne hapla TaxID=6305 RepID=A0A1I8BYN8_MELHA
MCICHFFNYFKPLFFKGKSIGIIKIRENCKKRIGFPDTFVIFRLENLTINCTSEFYKLLHVCVNNNFGEQLILQPETIPIELLELPEIDLESLEKYATFCVRLKLKGVQLNLLTPTSPFETNSFEKFATFSLQSVKVLFDSFIDSHSEIDIICKNATLEDSTNSDNTAEPFKKLLKARHEKGFNKHVASSSTNKNIESKKLLCELHIQMARDECQIFSFILIKTRVFLLFEWIEKLKLFLLLVNSNSNEFSSKSGIHCRSSTNQQQQKYSKKHSSSSQKELLNQSSSSNNNQNNRITSMFKITLKDCELIILEDSSKSDSFGLIANTSGVILYNLYDNSNELFDIQCEIQDYFIVKYIIDKSLITWEKSQNQKFFWSDSNFGNKNIHQIKQGEENQRVIIPKKWRLNADQLCIWLLKETTSSTSGSGNNIGISMAPFLRFNLFELNALWTSRHTEMNFAVGVDNYRERPPLGWEPLFERWRIARLELDEHSQRKWNLWLRSADDSLAELNITQTFLEELIDFIAMNNELFKQTTNNKTLNSFNDLIEETRNEHSKTPKTSIIENNSFSESYKVQKQKHSNSASFSAKQRSNSGTSTSSRSNAFDPIRISHPSGIDLDIQLDLPAGIGISLIGNSCENNDSADELQQEELIYARFYSVRVGVQRRQNNTYVCSCSSQSIQFDNQILGADRHNLFFCDPNALRGPYPALNFEMSYTSTDILDAYESFRLKLCNSCVLLDEQLLWRLINFGKNIIDYRRNKLGQQQHQTQQVTKNCYFGAFQLEFGDISLSVLTIDKNALPPRLRLLKEKYAETLLLVNFENALVTLAPFWAHRCLTTFNNLFANIVDFYIGQLKRQKLSIFVAMDAIGNPLGFANEFKEGFEGLLFEGDVAGFTFGIGYGAANSISKVASSMAQGVGALTFDDQHEQFRRWMLRSKPEQEANALAYLYGGLKGFGVGVFGGLTAIARNTVVAARQEGVLPGVIRGVTTGAVDTFTKPLQGTLDLVEGTASAIREVVGAPLVRRAHFPKRRLRSPRVCSSMSGLLPSYSNELAEAQQDLLRITGTYALNDDNRLLSIVPFYERFTPEGWIIRHRALIVPSQSYICRNIIEGGEDYNFEEKTIVTHRILFEHLKNVQISSSNQLSLNKHKRSSSSSNLKTTNTSRPVGIDIFYNNNSNQQLNSSFNYNYQFNNNKQQPALTLLCTNTECAQYLSKQMMKAKVLYEKHLQIKRVNNCKNDGKKKIFPIFTI